MQERRGLTSTRASDCSRIKALLSGIRESGVLQGFVLMLATNIKVTPAVHLYFLSPHCGTQSPAAVHRHGLAKQLEADGGGGSEVTDQTKMVMLLNAALFHRFGNYVI